MSDLELRGWKKTIQSDKKMLKFVDEKHVGQIRKGRANRYEEMQGCSVHRGIGNADREHNW